MNVTDLKTQMHMQEWAKLIEARQDSGLSIKEWCRQNNPRDAAKPQGWNWVQGPGGFFGYCHCAPAEHSVYRALYSA